MIHSTCLVTRYITRSRLIGLGIAVPAQIAIILAASSAIGVMEPRVSSRESKLEAGGMTSVDNFPGTL